LASGHEPKLASLLANSAGNVCTTVDVCATGVGIGDAPLLLIVVASSVISGPGATVGFAAADNVVAALAVDTSMKLATSTATNAPITGSILLKNRIQPLLFHCGHQLPEGPIPKIRDLLVRSLGRNFPCIPFDAIQPKRYSRGAYAKRERFVKSSTIVGSLSANRAHG
jgi:hypothetical protein